jgi:RHS repeat-associated protein
VESAAKGKVGADAEKGSSANLDTSDYSNENASAQTAVAVPGSKTGQAGQAGQAGQGAKGPEGVLTTNTLVYLHGDHLGSMSSVSNASGQKIGEQEFDPWGKVRTVQGGAGPVTQTKQNYTGQKLDDTVLLFYNARYYDSALGRFVSPDSIVPGSSWGAGGALGTIGAEQNSRLTVDFHENERTDVVNHENTLTLSKGFWFQLDPHARQGSREPFGPTNPQAIGRYSYVLNNPLRYEDPTGHYSCFAGFCAGGTVLNKSGRSIQVTGDFPNPKTPDGKPFIRKTIILGPGESTTQYGMIDADFIHTDNMQTGEYVKVSDGATAEVRDSSTSCGGYSISARWNNIFALLAGIKEGKQPAYHIRNGKDNEGKDIGDIPPPEPKAPPKCPCPVPGPVRDPCQR